MPSYTHYIDWISSQELHILNRLKQWVEINTFSRNVKGLKKLSNELQSCFESIGAATSLIKLAPQKILNEDGIIKSHPVGPLLIAWKRENAPIQVLLGGHMDTVFSPQHAFQDFDSSVSGIYKGPGVADMKGGLAILLTSLEALERSPFAQEIGWKVILNSDEEIGSPQSAAYFKKSAAKFNCGIIFEPSFPDGAFVNQRKGSASYTLAVHGRAAHVGRDFSAGKSAVFAIMHFIQKLEALKCNRELIINVADLVGKGPLNIVPSFAICRINARTSDTTLLSNFLTHLQNIAIECEEEGIRFELIQENERLPKHFDKPTQGLFKAYAQCASELSLPFQTRETGGVCDGNTLAQAGLPTLDTAGAIGGGLHTTDEYVNRSSLIERAQLTALFLFKLANRESVIDKESSNER